MYFALRSKVEAGRMELELTTFDLPLAIDNARTFVRERATKHGITLEVEVDDRLGAFVGDERKIKQILLNLLSNAVKFTPEGGRIASMPGRSTGQWKSQSVILVSALLPRTNQGYSKSFARWASTIRTKSRAPDSASRGQEVRRAARGRVGQGLYLQLYPT